jgi:hypothetical protein
LTLTFAPDQGDSLARVSRIEPIPGEFELPPVDEVRSRLQWLGVAADAIDEAVEGLPSRERNPDAWALLERLYRELLTREDGPLWWPWPESGDDPLSRFFQLYVFIAALPSARELHRSRGIGEEISLATLRDVALSVEWYRRRHGRPGFNSAFWMAQHFRGGLFLLGRLQFNFWHVVFAPPSGAGFRKDDPCLGVHIPALGPLTPEACAASFARAREFFPAHFPDRRDKVATCSSWLLDPQLAEYLREDTNIIRFQRMFTPAPDRGEPGDDDVVRFVFGYVPDSIDELPQTTTLERAAVAHIKSGRHWAVRSGWVDL